MACIVFLITFHNLIFYSEIAWPNESILCIDLLLDRAQLLTQNLLKQGYVTPRLKSSLSKLYGRYHNLVGCVKISISTDMNLYILMCQLDHSRVIVNTMYINIKQKTTSHIYMG
jgi:hypothetical protein